MSICNIRSFPLKNSTAVLKINIRKLPYHSQTHNRSTRSLVRSHQNILNYFFDCFHVTVSNPQFSPLRLPTMRITNVILNLIQTLKPMRHLLRANKYRASIFIPICAKLSVTKNETHMERTQVTSSLWLPLSSACYWEEDAQIKATTRLEIMTQAQQSRWKGRDQWLFVASFTFPTARPPDTAEITPIIFTTSDFNLTTCGTLTPFRKHLICGMPLPAATGCNRNRSFNPRSRCTPSGKVRQLKTHCFPQAICIDSHTFP